MKSEWDKGSKEFVGEGYWTYNSDEICWRIVRGPFFHVEATHWMPLPEPPK